MTEISLELIQGYFPNRLDVVSICKYKKYSIPYQVIGWFIFRYMASQVLLQLVVPLSHGSKLPVFEFLPKIAVARAKYGNADVVIGNIPFVNFLDFYIIVFS